VFCLFLPEIPSRAGSSRKQPYLIGGVTTADFDGLEKEQQGVDIPLCHLSVLANAEQQALSVSVSKDHRLP
jgi:hypothetical protein